MRPTHQNIMRPGFLGEADTVSLKILGLQKSSSDYIFRSKRIFLLTSSSIKINKRMPQFDQILLKNLPNKNKRYKILILGAAYKQDIGDTRLSPLLISIRFYKKTMFTFVIHFLKMI